MNFNSNTERDKRKIKPKISFKIHLYVSILSKILLVHMCWYLHTVYSPVS